MSNTVHVESNVHQCALNILLLFHITVYISGYMLAVSFIIIISA